MKLKKIIKDKKGLISIGLAGGLIPIVIGIIAILLIVSLFAIGWFLQANLITLIGGAVLILSIVFGFKPLIENPTQTKIAIFMMFIILSGTLMAIPYFDDSFYFSIGSGTFVKPSWARLECAPTDAYEGSYIKWLDQISTFKCDAFTEECEFTVENQDTGFWAQSATGNYQNCDLYGSNCGAKISYTIRPGATITLPKLASGRSYKFETGFWIVNEDYTKITQQWRPWMLYRFVGGGKWVVNSYNCDVTSGSKARIRQEDYVSKLYRQGGEGTKWINYVDDWNYGPGTNVFNHPQYGEVYCTAGQIFEIVELRMSDGALKKVDPTYSQTLPSGDRLNGLGSRLSYVECCPNEPSCTDDFEYKKPEEVEVECVSDIQCYNAGGPVPVDRTHYIVYKCVNGGCVESAPITVECTTSAQCPAGQICDLSTNNYGKCISQIAGQYCGDNICQLSENFDTCPSDCDPNKISCEEQGGTLIVKTKIQGKGPLGIGKLFGWTYDEVTEVCRIPHVSALAITLLILGIGILIFSIFKSVPIGMMGGVILTLLGAVWSILAGVGYV